MRHQTKRDISFCLLSKFDEYCDKEEGNAALLGEFWEQFNEKGMVGVWERRVEWMSRPS